MNERTLRTAYVIIALGIWERRKTPDGGMKQKRRSRPGGEKMERWRGPGRNAKQPKEGRKEGRGQRKRGGNPWAGTTKTKKNNGLARIRTADTGFKVLGANHYTTRPLLARLDLP